MSWMNPRSCKFACCTARGLAVRQPSRHPKFTPSPRQQTRTASTSSNPYPFPAAKHPSPHQIFHLPTSASRADVKTRYYELVRIYHPDSAVSRSVPSDTAHARFQAISAAYAILSGKRPAAANPDGAEEFAPRADYHDLSSAMWRAKQRRRAELDVGLDDRWKERLMMGAILLSVVLFVGSTYTARQTSSGRPEKPSWSWRIPERDVGVADRGRARQRRDDDELALLSAAPSPNRTDPGVDAK